MATMSTFHVAELDVNPGHLKLCVMFLGLFLSSFIPTQCPAVGPIISGCVCAFFRVPRRNQVSQKVLMIFYQSSIESILTYCMSVWFSSCTEAERKRLQSSINIAQKNICCPHPSMEDSTITKDTSTPGSRRHPLADAKDRSGPQDQSLSTQAPQRE